MEAGKLRGNAATDPIVRAIALAETGTTGEIRVHLSKRLWEKDPYGYALKIFERFGMTRTRQRNAILLYVNLRRKRFAIIGDQGIDQVVGRNYWRELGQQLSEALRSTAPERAIATIIASMSETLREHFPAEHSITAEETPSR